MRIIKTKKKFGQHFLTNENIASKLVNEITSKENILEIGPGTGNLTSHILKKKPKKIIVIEKDQNLAKKLARGIIIIAIIDNFQF